MTAAGIAYGIASGGNFGAAQQGFFGSTGNGWATSQVGSTAQQQGLINATNAKVATAAMGSASALTGSTKLYNGNCGAGLTVSQCQQSGLDAGTIWRPDSYTEYNSTKAMRQRLSTCTAPTSQGGLGLIPGSLAAQQCAAPAVGGISPINTGVMSTVDTTATIVNTANTSSSTLTCTAPLKLVNGTCQ